MRHHLDDWIQTQCICHHHSSIGGRSLRSKSKTLRPVVGLASPSDPSWLNAASASPCQWVLSWMPRPWSIRRVLLQICVKCIREASGSTIPVFIFSVLFLPISWSCSWSGRLPWVFLHCHSSSIFLSLVDSRSNSCSSKICCLLCRPELSFPASSVWLLSSMPSFSDRLGLWNERPTWASIIRFCLLFLVVIQHGKDSQELAPEATKVYLYSVDKVEVEPEVVLALGGGWIPLHGLLGWHLMCPNKACNVLKFLLQTKQLDVPSPSFSSRSGLSPFFCGSKGSSSSTCLLSSKLWTIFTFLWIFMWPVKAFQELNPLLQNLHNTLGSWSLQAPPYSWLIFSASSDCYHLPQYLEYEFWYNSIGGQD